MVAVSPLGLFAFEEFKTSSNFSVVIQSSFHVFISFS